MPHISHIVSHSNYTRLGTGSSVVNMVLGVKRLLPLPWSLREWQLSCCWMKWRDLLCYISLTCVFPGVKLRDETKLALILFKIIWGECWRRLWEKWMEPIQWPAFAKASRARGLIEQLITLIQSGLGKPWKATATCKICSRQTPCHLPHLLKYDPILGSPTFSSSLLEVHSPIISGACLLLRTRRCMNKPWYSIPPL